MFKIKNGKLQLGKEKEEVQQEEVQQEEVQQEEVQQEEVQQEEVQQEEDFKEEIVVKSDTYFHKVVFQFSSGHLSIDFYDVNDLTIFLNDLDVAMKLKSIVKVEDVVINCSQVLWYKVEEWIDDGKEE